MNSSIFDGPRPKEVFMRTSIIVLLVTILAAALLGILAYIRYRRRLNEALSDSSDPSIRQHSSASPAEFVP